MPFDVSGNFTRSYDFEEDRNNGIKILASRMDGEFDNFSTGMNLVFFRDGRVPMSSSLQMGLNRITGLADGTAAAPAIKFSTDPNTGSYLDGISRYAISANSVQRLVATVTGVDVTGTLTSSGAATLNSASITGALVVGANCTVGGTLGVTGNVTMAGTLGVTGNVTMAGTLGVTGAVSSGGNQLATLASPAFTGTPTAPTAAFGTNTTQLATTAYVNAQGFITTAALATYAPLASPTFTGTPAAPTAAPGTNTTQIATTAYVNAQGYATLASPALTGVPTAPTAANGNNTTQLATTAFVKNQAYAPLADPAFTGNPTAPTATKADNDTSLATTAFVQTGKVPQIQSVASAATVTPTFGNDMVLITALAAACQLLNPTGTAVDGWGIVVRIKDNGTARALTYDTQYRAIGCVLPTTTIVNKTLYLGMVWNDAATKWDVLVVAQEA